jgi:hypothetical protein
MPGAAMLMQRDVLVNLTISVVKNKEIATLPCDLLKLFNNSLGCSSLFGCFGENSATIQRVINNFTNG